MAPCRSKVQPTGQPAPVQPATVQRAPEQRALSQPASTPLNVSLITLIFFGDLIFRYLLISHYYTVRLFDPR